MSLKYFSLFISGCFAGSIIVASLLLPQIENRYNIGVNSGYIQGGNHIIEFIKKHLKQTTITGEVISLHQHLDHKVSRVSLISINGVKTLNVR